MGIDPVLMTYNIVRSDAVLNENLKYVNICIDEALGINDEVMADAKKLFGKIVKDIWPNGEIDATGDVKIQSRR